MLQSRAQGFTPGPAQAASNPPPQLFSGVCGRRGPFLLTHLLMKDLSRAAPHARVVNVCSLLGEYLGAVDWGDLL